MGVDGFYICPPSVVEQLRFIEARITTRESQVSLLRNEYNQIANDEAAKVAEFQVGQVVEYKTRKQTRRYRIIGIVGQLYEYDDLPARLHIKYNGVLLKKDGTEGVIEYGLYGIKAISSQ